MLLKKTEREQYATDINRKRVVEWAIFHMQMLTPNINSTIPIFYLKSAQHVINKLIFIFVSFKDA